MSRRRKPIDTAKDFVVREKDRDGWFAVKETESKGRGVFASVDINSGDFLLEYGGELISGPEGERRERTIPSVFRYFFQYKGKTLCVDATEETNDGGVKLGRLVNHASPKVEECNAKMKVVDVEGHKVALCLFAIKNIRQGDEILYDYGIKKLPWESKQSEVVQSKDVPPPEEGKGEGEQGNTEDNAELRGKGKRRGKDGRCEDDENDGEEREKEDRGGQGREQGVAKGGNEGGKGGQGVKDKDHEGGQEDRADGGRERGVGNAEQGKAKAKRGTEEPIRRQEDTYSGRWEKEIQILNSEVGVKTIGSFQFSRKAQIAMGSNGTQVFVGKWVTKPEYVAVKRINKQVAENEIAVMNHIKDSAIKNVLTPIAYTEDEDFTYLVSSLCEYNLQDLIEGEKEKLRNTRRVEICLDFLTGLKELHSRGIIHRDLKPSNILFDSSGKLFVSDFGVSRVDVAKTTHLTGAVGTLCWMAKEALEGNLVIYKQSSDIQVAGFILYYILTDGHLPHESTSPYSAEPSKAMGNILKSKFSFQQLEQHFPMAKPTIQAMIVSQEHQRPMLDACIEQFQEFYKNAKAEEVLLRITSSEEMAAQVPSDPDDESSSESEDSCTSTFNPLDEGSDSGSSEYEEDDPSNPLCFLVNDDDDASNDQDAISDGETDGGDDNKESKEAYVFTTSGGPHRKWDKYSYCLYCEARQTKLLRHCRTHHLEEQDVARAIHLEESQQKHESEKIWTKIRNLGNHNHNKEVHQGRSFDLIVKKRPKNGRSASITRYVPCPDCYGYYYTKTLWFHRKNCTLRSQNSPKSSKHVKEGRALLPSTDNISGPFKKVMNSMVPDDISFLAKSDIDIVDVGHKEFDKSNSSKRGDLAREKMRNIAKLLKVTRECESRINMAADLVKPWAFNSVVNGVRCLSGYDEETQEHARYSNALRLGFAVKDLAVAVKARSIKEGNREQAAEVDEFLQLKESEWRAKITAPALRQRGEQSWKKPKILPLTADCVKFNAYLHEKEAELKRELKTNGIDVESYKKLAKITLTRVIFFNRRRPREVETITIEDYLKQTTKKNPIQDEILESMTTSERLASDRLTLLMVRGKRGRGVPVLLTQAMQESIDMLISFHKKREVLPKHIFARTTSSAETPLRAYDCMTELANQANLQAPEHMRTTKLRKHIATVTQVLGLKKTELEQLANHMGHDIQIHREYYRLPQEALMLAKVSKLLILADKGHLHKFAGKSLDEIEINPNDEIDDELVDEEDEADTEDDVNPSEHDIQYEVAGPSHKAHRTDPSTTSNSTAGRKYKKWTKQQEEFLLAQRVIQRHLKRKSAPGKHEGMLIIKESKGLLADKSWKEVKDKIHNINQQERRSLQRQVELRNPVGAGSKSRKSTK